MFNVPPIAISTNNIQVGTIGLVIELKIKKNNSVMDVSSASVKQIIILKPDGITKTINTATFSTNGTDGLIRYVTTGSGEINQAGDYQVQGYLEMSGVKSYTSIVQFHVVSNL